MPSPNLLFVFADQMRGCDLGCAGNAQVQTPHMDRLAREGTLLPGAFANCPVCTPSRGVLLTGLYPHHNRVIANDLPLPEEVPTIGNVLQDAGYRTSYIGKWHLDGVPRSRWTPPGPRRHGFEDWQVWNCAHRYFDGQLYGGDTPTPEPLPGYEPAAQTDRALDFLARNEEDERPFCLFLSWGPPHDPYPDVPEAFQSLYSPDAMRLRPNVAPLAFPTRDPAATLGPERCLALYYAAITALDTQLGRLLDALDTRGLSDNTVVVFTSDHGDMLFSQGRLKKQQPWDESVRIPFLIRGPGIAAGARPTTLLSTVDFTPSLLGLLGVETSRTFDGADLSPALRGQPMDGPESVFLMELVTTDEGLHQHVTPWRGVRTATHTWARRGDGTPWLLYDNAHDPFQQHNLVGTPGAAPLQAVLDTELSRWLASVGDDCRAGEDLLRALDLTDLWNARERELHGDHGRFV